jgi:signal transduction histidine kinase
MVLARPAAPGTAAALALAALARLDREINGGAGAPARALISCRSVLEQAAERWAGPAARAGGTVRLRWHAGSARVLADPGDLERAVDNLLANAIEHGSPPVRLEAGLRRGRVRIAVIDCGGGEADRGARRPLRGRSRGHGLRLVRRFAARHGGRFFLERGDGGTMAVLELPLATAGGRRSAA